MMTILWTGTRHQGLTISGMDPVITNELFARAGKSVAGTYFTDTTNCCVGRKVLTMPLPRGSDANGTGDEAGGGSGPGGPKARSSFVGANFGGFMAKGSRYLGRWPWRVVPSNYALAPFRFCEGQNTLVLPAYPRPGWRTKF